jgi:hypothetical protein
MTDRRTILASSIANSIVEASREPDGAIVVHSRDAQQALASVLAMLLEAEPILDTPAKLHEACSLLAAETLIQVKAMRQQYELTGSRPWDAEVLTIN